MLVKNPILKGFHPDPSILRVGEDYYIANSTFEWYPGVRIYHSRNLADWELAGMPLDRTALLDMTGVNASDGIWAPCLSWSGGWFYLIFTVVHTSHQYAMFDTPNYVTRARKIEGPWEEPVYLNSSGFDPSLFHDDDGRKWLVNMEWDYRGLAFGRAFPGILLQEYDSEQKRLVGSPKKIFPGTARRLTEGPHLYKKDGWYYLVCAEGGTSWFHCVTVARSKKIGGPYEVHPGNPLLTSWEGTPDSDVYEKELEERGLNGCLLQKAGHGSLCQGPGGRWYLAHLCSRPIPGTRSCVLGRETAIQEIVWKDGWPWLKGGGSLPAETYEVEDDPGSPDESSAAAESGGSICLYRFGQDRDLVLRDFQTLRRPLSSEDFSFEARPGYLRLRGRESLYSRFRQSIRARRQTDFAFDARTSFEFSPESFQHMAGLVYRYNEENQYACLVSFDEAAGERVVTAVAIRQGILRVLDTRPVGEGPYTLTLQVDGVRGHFGFLREGVWELLDGELDTEILSDDFTGGFTGAFVGIVAMDLRSQEKYADFADFCYTGRPEGRGR